METQVRKEQYSSIAEYLTARNKMLNKQAFIGFLLFLVCGALFARWLMTESVAWLLPFAFFAPLAIPTFIKAMRTSEEFAKLQKNLLAEVFIERIALATIIGNTAPAGATQMRLFPLDKNPITRYAPIQWWDDERALTAVDREIFEPIEVYQETVAPWLAGEFQNSLLISLDKVFHDLFKLEELGAVSHRDGVAEGGKP